jgi:hypothetical protein
MIYGATAFGQLAYSSFDIKFPTVNAAWEAFLREITTPRAWEIEIDALPLAASGARTGTFSGSTLSALAFSGADAAAVTGALTTLRYSTHGYTSKGTDTPAYTHYRALMLTGPRLERAIVGRNGIGGLTRCLAQAVLDNRDGTFDSLNRNYATDGRNVTIRSGRPTDPLTSHGIVFKGVVAGEPVIALDKVTIPLSDGIARLAVRVNPNTYAGTGGLEGGTDLKGKPKPKCYGQVPNVSALLVDTVKLIYQVHDGAINDVPKVYDRGIDLSPARGADYVDLADLNATAPAAGSYRVLKSGGYFRLGSAPSGTVTADVQGDAPASGGYVNRTALIIMRLLSAAGLTSSDIEPTSFGVLDTDQPAAVGIYRGAEIATIDDMVDELLAGAGAFGGFTRYGAFQVGQIKTASGTEKDTLTDAHILSIERVPLPDPVMPTVWRTFVGWGKNYTVQPDLAAAVPADRKAFTAEAIRYSKAEDASISSRRLLAKELTVDADFALEADAAAETLRIFNLWGKPREIYKVTTRPRALTRDLGDVVVVKHRRFGLAAGISMRVIGHAVNGNQVQLTVLR